MTIHILGRQPALGLAELESLYGPARLTSVQPEAAVLDITDPKQPSPDRLGGTIKTAELLSRLETSDWNKVIDYLVKSLPKHVGHFPDGKIKLGISVIGFDVNVKSINAAGLKLKKSIKNTGRSVRVVPNTEPVLSSAQTMHNNLASGLGHELVLVRDGNSTLVGKVNWVQDINSYTKRDRSRPKRDTRVGMLPPKLAQIIINLAGKHVLPKEAQIDPDHPVNKEKRQSRLLDPFCGTGVILQEAALMNYAVYGTDLDERMIRYTRDNLNWLKDTTRMRFDWYLHEADATDTQWQQPFDLVATETYLGRPFSALPSPEVLGDVIQDVNTILKKFLQNIADQTASGFRMCVAVPAWKTGEKFKHLPLIDCLGELGYNRVSFRHAATKDLIYYRPGQIVARELLVLTRK